MGPPPLRDWQPLTPLPSGGTWAVIPSLCSVLAWPFSWKGLTFRWLLEVRSPGAWTPGSVSPASSPHSLSELGMGSSALPCWPR